MALGFGSGLWQVRLVASQRDGYRYMGTSGNMRTEEVWGVVVSRDSVYESRSWGIRDGNQGLTGNGLGWRVT